MEKEELKKFEEIYEMKSKEYEIEQYHFENEAEKEIKINKE